MFEQSKDLPPCLIEVDDKEYGRTILNMDNILLIKPAKPPSSFKNEIFTLILFKGESEDFYFKFPFEEFRKRWIAYLSYKN